MRPSLLVLILLVYPPAARAAAEDDPRAIEARKACASGEVDHGIKLLADYLAHTDDATAIYNMGRCYEQNGIADKAVLQFREYLRKAPGLSPADRAEVEAHISELEKAPPAASLAAPVAATTSEVPAGRPGLRTAGLAVAGAGVAGVALGIYFGLHARSLSDEVEKARQFSAADNDAGRTAHTLQFVMYGLGAAAVAGGALLYYFGLDGSERVSVAPAVGARAAGALVRVRL